MEGKLLIFSAPSGSGKTTIVQSLLERIPSLEFSISATSRNPRSNEEDGKDYYFINPEEFRRKIKNNEFVEWEEVYKDTFYGTLKTELKRIWNNDKHVIFDVDVIGGLNIKKQYPERALSIFISVPSFEELEKRLRNRSTESEENLQKRLLKAKEEMKYAEDFDITILNENIDKAINEAEEKVKKFIS